MEIKGKYLGNAEKTSSRVITSLTSSWAVTASYALNAKSSTDTSVAEWVAAASGNLASVTSSLMTWSASAKTSITALNTATGSINGKTGSWTSAATWVGANSASLVSSASAAKSTAAWIAANSGAIGSATGSSHTHSNKAVLDGITAAKTSSWDSKTDNTGTVTSITITTGSNYMSIVSGGSAITTVGTRRVDLATTTKNKIESGSVAFNWVSANSGSFVSGNHFHDNKALLDSLTNSKTASWDKVTPLSDSLYKFEETVLPRYLGGSSSGAFYIQTNIDTGSNRFLYFDIEEYLYKAQAAPGHTIIQAYWSSDSKAFSANYKNMIHLGSPIGSNINLVADSEGYIGLFFNVEQNWSSLKIRMNRGTSEGNSTSNAFIRTSVHSLKSGSEAKAVSASAAVFVAPDLQYISRAEASNTSDYALNSSGSTIIRASRDFNRAVILGETSMTETTTNVPLHFRESLYYNPSTSVLTITSASKKGASVKVTNGTTAMSLLVGSAGVNTGLYDEIGDRWTLVWSGSSDPTASFGTQEVVADHFKGNLVGTATSASFATNWSDRSYGFSHDASTAQPVYIQTSIPTASNRMMWGEIVGYSHGGGVPMRTFFQAYWSNSSKAFLYYRAISEGLPATTFVAVADADGYLGYYVNFSGATYERLRAKVYSGNSTVNQVSSITAVDDLASLSPAVTGSFARYVSLRTDNYLDLVNGAILAQPVASGSGTSGTITLASGKFNKCGTLSGDVTFTLGSSVGNSRQDIYAGNFSMGSTVYNVSWPSSVKWVEGSPDTSKPNSKYEFNIVDNLGVLVRS